MIITKHSIKKKNLGPCERSKLKSRGFLSLQDHKLT